MHGSTQVEPCRRVCVYRANSCVSLALHGYYVMCTFARTPKKVLLKQARMVYWKKRAAKDEHEELTGVWLVAIQAEVWTDKHRNVTRKLVVREVGCSEDCTTIGWSDEKKKARRSTDCTVARVGREVRIPERLGNWEQKSKNIRERLEVAEEESCRTP